MQLTTKHIRVTFQRDERRISRKTLRCWYV